MIEVTLGGFGGTRGTDNADRTGGVAMRSWTRRVWSGYARTAIVGTASAGLLLVTLGTAAGQDDPPAVPFANGTAKATAVVARVAPGVGALELGISAGVAVAEIKNTIGQAQAEALDLGLIGSTLTAESCLGDGLPPSALPSALRVDSRGGDTSADEDEAPVDGATIGGGRKHVEAATTPAARAVSTVAGVLGPLVTFDAGKATSSTEVIPGKARVARSQVNVSIDIGGAIKLSGLRWEAIHRTGTDPDAEATFDLGTASLLGVPIPLESLTQLETTLNTALASSGVQITFPKVERFTTPADLIRVTPLRILLKDTPIGKAALGTAPQRQPGPARAAVQPDRGLRGLCRRRPPRRRHRPVRRVGHRVPGDRDRRRGGDDG